jgi:hypothetical protein
VGGNTRPVGFNPSDSTEKITLQRLSLSLMLRPTVSRPVCLGIKLTTRYLLVFDNYGPVFVGVLSDERTGLSFVYAAGPRQRSLSWVRVPLDS